MAKNRLNIFLSITIVILTILLISSMSAGEKQFEAGKLVGLQLADKGYIGGHNDAANESYGQIIEAYNTGVRDGEKLGRDEGISSLFMLGRSCSKEELIVAHNQGFGLGHSSGLGQPEFEENLLSGNDAEYIVLHEVSYAEIDRITGRNTSSNDVFRLVIPHIKGVNRTFDEPSAGYGMLELVWISNEPDK